jgi:hypothetical protein
MPKDDNRQNTYGNEWWKPLWWWERTSKLVLKQLIEDMTNRPINLTATGSEKWQSAQVGLMDRYNRRDRYWCQQGHKLFNISKNWNTCIQVLEFSVQRYWMIPSVERSPPNVCKRMYQYFLALSAGDVLLGYAVQYVKYRACLEK